jgi:hypothetical protein
MALYRSAAAGTVDLDDEISMQASDVQAYGTGSLYTKPVGHTITLRECAGYLIKESDNTAWKMLDRYLGRDYIRSELYAAGARSTEYWIPNTTTPNDVLIMLEKISDPSYTTPDLSDEMLALMTNTDFEDRLPHLLPNDARVSHKIGSYGATFGDAGVVFANGSRLLYSGDGGRDGRGHGPRRHAGDVAGDLPHLYRLRPLEAPRQPSVYGTPRYDRLGRWARIARYDTWRGSNVHETRYHVARSSLDGCNGGFRGIGA